jgi:NDP-sugar pyrophosphorylase family protein
MRELTDDLPKPMIPVQGKPILQRILEGLRAAGISRAQIIVGYRAEVVRDFFGDGKDLGMHLEYATQVVQDGTGKVVELARDFVGDQPFILSYGDILVDPHNYLPLAQIGEAEAIVTVKRNESEMAKGGCVVVNADFELTDLIEKPSGPPPSPWYNAGIYAFRPSLFEFTARLERSPRGEFELTDAIRALAQTRGRVRAQELSGSWADVRDPEILAQLNSQP